MSLLFGKVTILQFLKFFQHIQDLRSVFLLSDSNYHFLPSVLVKAVIVTSLDVVVMMHLLEMVRCFLLVVHNINKVGEEA